MKTQPKQPHPRPFPPAGGKGRLLSRDLEKKQERSITLMHTDPNPMKEGSPLQLERGRGRGRTAGGEAEKQKHNQQFTYSLTIKFFIL